MADHVPQGLFLVDAHFQELVYANPYTARIARLEFSEIERDPKNVFAHVVPAHRERVDEALANASDGETSISIEYRGDAGQGREYWYLTRVFPIEVDGQVRLCGVTQGITDRVKVRQELEQSERRNRILLEQSPAIIWALDRDLVFRSSSGSGLEALGLQSGEVVGVHLIDYVGDPNAISVQMARRALAGESVNYQDRFQHLTFRVHVEPLRDEEGEIIGCLGTALDVTEIVSAQDRLADSEQRMRVMLEQLPAIVWVVNRDLMIEFSSGAGLHSIDLVPGQLVGTPLMATLREGEDDDALGGHLQALAGQSYTAQSEWRGRWYRTHIEPLRDGNGVVIGALGISLEITDRVEAESALLKSEEEVRHQLAELHVIYDSTPVGLGTMNEDLRFARTNGELERLLRIGRSAAVGRMPSQIDEHWGNDLEALAREVSEDRTARLNVEFEARFPGSSRPRETWIVSFFPLFPVEMSDRLGGVTIAVQDITPQKALEMRLRRESEEAQRLLEGLAAGTSTSVGVRFFPVLVQTIARLMDVACCLVSEYTEPGVSGRTLAVAVEGKMLDNFDFRVSGTPSAEVRAGGVVYYERDLQRLFPDHTFLIDYSLESYCAYSLTGSRGQLLGHLAVMNDGPLPEEIRDLPAFHIFAARAAAELERKRVSDQVDEFEHELTHASRLNTLGEMSAGIAHELNQPLSAISTYGTVCLAQFERKNDEEVRELLEKIRYQAKRGGEIIRSLRQLAQTPTTDRESVSLNRLVEEVLLLCESDFDRYRVRPRRRFSRDLPSIFCHAVQIQQVILNLIRNAIEALSTIGGERKLDVITEPQGGGVTLRVIDNGPGLSDSEFERVWDPFWSTKEKGMGLGLRICRRIIEAHGGVIDARRNEGGGMSFWFELPLHGLPSEMIEDEPSAT